MVRGMSRWGRHASPSGVQAVPPLSSYTDTSGGEAGGGGAGARPQQQRKRLGVGSRSEKAAGVFTKGALEIERQRCAVPQLKTIRRPPASAVGSDRTASSTKS